MSDILLKSDGWIWSYRVAAIIERDGKVLLVDHVERSTHEYAFPGGHVQFGETSAAALIREIKEETNLDIEVSELRWIEENFWSWNGKPTHQICMYYMAKLRDYQGNEDTLQGHELYDNEDTSLVFRWLPISELKTVNVYPRFAYNALQKESSEIQHFTSHSI